MAENLLVKVKSLLEKIRRDKIEFTGNYAGIIET